ncbi:MAG: trypsin-like peptidase domain-containing protein [Peptoniphilaceae bacterium]|nr:trypsin-like peptidase domain-containing protein [Peptoniphilaceae bacterium]MDY5766616.1 trypsin-like peptidase domain-containing protein [Peptoniphilaceae bacterium]MDY5841971.1 trypsin-like peptidase domain-containing protein [Peptoniphilaceae bacterium]
MEGNNWVDKPYETDNHSENSQYHTSKMTTDADVRKLVREEIQRNYRPKHHWAGILALVLCGALLGGLTGTALVTSGALGIPQTQVAKVPQQQKVSIDLQGDKTTVENAVAAKSIPSIVGITTISRGRATSNPFYYGIPRYTESVGSGIIVSSDGYILTNSHVVDNGSAKEVTVLLSTGEEIQANVVWNDSSLDLAVIKVERTDLPTMEFADSSKIQVGDKAIAIGNPLGLDLQSTLTSGYISGLDRSITLEDGNIMDGLIQTDAAINGGNSGGALLNAEGKLIGINTAKPQEADGIGFAIPANIAKSIVDKIIATGSYEPVYMGITGYNVRIAAQLGVADLPTEAGVLVRDVVAGSPASKAGITAGDVITAIDGKPVDSMNALKQLLLNYKTGDKIDVTVYHEKKEETRSLTFEAFSMSETSKEDVNKPEK